VGGDFLQGFLNSYDIDLFLNLKKFVELALTYHITSHEQSGISLNPQLDISLRSCTNDYIRIYFNDEVIGETDATRAPKELFPGAIYMAQGEKYLVKDLSFADRKAYVKYYPLDESTVVISKKDISIEEYDTSREIIGREVMVGKGRLNLKEYLIEYLRINNMGDVLERGKLNYEPRRLVVDGIWIIFTNDFKNRHLQIDFPQAMHGLQHMITNLTPIHALCDLADISGASYNRHRNLKGNSGIFVFETNEYGVGIIDTVYNNLENLLTESLSLLTSCPCQNGCPKCIHSPYCSSENKDLDKNETINLIEAILNEKNALSP
jgi:DEAD/DEAH box helicase domain-containing protein